MYMYVFTVFKTNVCVPLCSAKGIDDVALNKKEISLSLSFYPSTTFPTSSMRGNVGWKKAATAVESF